ncbi:MAG: biotin/lipoyl-binding protein [Lachnospiraceae bacterium]|nr:biotin/lipoyl-binding protein [Lachnospiraceae bacterium]
MAGAITLLFLSGCGQTDEKELAPPEDISYQASEKETVTAVKGDRTYAFEHEITLAGYDEVRYKISKEKMSEMETVYDMKLDSVNVVLGDHVKAGQVLVSFSSKELDEQLRQSKQSKELASLNLDHIRRLAALNPGKDYTEQIKVLENECKVADQYIRDVQSVYSQFNIIAEKDGIISMMSTALSQGSIVANDDLFKIVNGDGYYQMDLSMGEKTAGVTAEDFVVGDHYKARDDISKTEYEFVVIAPPSGREEKSNMVFFKPVAATDDFLGQSLEIIGDPITISNICYVNRKTIIKTDEGDFVFVKRDDGFYKAVKVELGDVIENDVVVKKGLNGGENVLIP